MPTALVPTLSLREQALILALQSMDGGAEDRVSVTKDAMSFLGDVEFTEVTANDLFQRLVDLRLIMRFGSNWAVTPNGLKALKDSGKHTARVSNAIYSMR